MPNPSFFAMVLMMQRVQLYRVLLRLGDSGRRDIVVVYEQLFCKRRVILDIPLNSSK
jgi:hypothetical protein